MEFLRILPRRLLEQLSDLEKDREDLGEEEYSEMRQDTLEQVFLSSVTGSIKPCCGEIAGQCPIIKQYSNAKNQCLGG